MYELDVRDDAGASRASKLSDWKQFHQHRFEHDEVYSRGLCLDVAVVVAAAVALPTSVAMKEVVEGEELPDAVYYTEECRCPS